VRNVTDSVHAVAPVGNYLAGFAAAAVEIAVRIHRRDDVTFWPFATLS
jgi:hypothetical protein